MVLAPAQDSREPPSLKGHTKKILLLFFSEESENASEYSSGSSEESEDDQPLMGRRRAARNVVSYNMKEYDNIMKTAIDDGKVKYSAEEMAGYVPAGTQVMNHSMRLTISGTALSKFFF